uniref:Uncharacterized protein n=1 Tax=Siphoviridae sp. ctOCb13 TaxID=2825477 RepID=A0A8S5Q1W4_9CAUD|nr:MAG TPA: hypothetical protein [Siphoviridae sp. ctOCb13]
MSCTPSLTKLQLILGSRISVIYKVSRLTDNRSRKLFTIGAVIMRSSLQCSRLFIRIVAELEYNEDAFEPCGQGSNVID